MICQIIYTGFARDIRYQNQLSASSDTNIRTYSLLIAHDTRI